MAAVTDDAVAAIEEVVADKGYHSRTTIHDLQTLAIRTYISEPDRGPNRGLIKTPNGVQCTRIAGVFEAAVANGSCADAENC